MKRRSAILVFSLAWVALAAACKSVGPPHVLRDRFDYSEALSRSWKDNMLLNLVKLRYADAPVFLDVTSVVAQYALQGQVSAGGEFPGLAGVNAASVGGALQWSDRPTITYQPLTGQRFIKSLLTPIPPASVMNLVQAGWPVDIIFRVAVRSINGVQAGTRNRLIGQPEDPRFGKLLDALRRLQQTGVLGMRVEKKGTEEASLVVISRVGGEATEQDRRFVAETLGIEPGLGEYRLVFASLSSSRDEIAMLTRSVIEILSDLAFDVQVPADHEKDGRVGPPLPAGVEKRTGFRVASGKDRPKDAFAAVRYEGYWFWIDNRDFSSKRAMSFMLVLQGLAETGKAVEGPALTISTGP